MSRASLLGISVAMLAVLTAGGCSSTSKLNLQNQADLVGHSVAPTGAPQYSDQANWLCLPGRKDACDVNLDTAVITKDGTVQIEKFERASQPAIDCFYVYPTVSGDEGTNSDLNAGSEERSVVAAQFARYGSVCRTFAPIYRQITLAALRANNPASRERPAAGMLEAWELAYEDVKNAWQHYLRTENQGRGVILVGHSQGAGMLRKLLGGEIERTPARELIVAAHLIGYNVTVPKSVRGDDDFQSMPLCGSRQETGCIVSYVSFRSNVPPPAGAIFGRSTETASEVACVNPAAPGSNQRLPLDPYFSNPADNSSSGSWIAGQTITQRFVKLPKFVSGECVDKDGAQYLAISVESDLRDRRTDVLVGDVEVAGTRVDAWGLHLIDVHLALGDLVGLADSQARGYRTQRKQFKEKEN